MNTHYAKITEQIAEEHKFRCYINHVDHGFVFGYGNTPKEAYANAWGQFRRKVNMLKSISKRQAETSIFRFDLWGRYME